MASNLWKGGDGSFRLHSNWSLGTDAGDDFIYSGDATVRGANTIGGVKSLFVGSAGELTVKGVLDSGDAMNYGNVFVDGVYAVGATTTPATFTNTVLATLKIGDLHGEGDLTVSTFDNAGAVDIYGLATGSNPTAILRVRGAAGLGSVGVLTGVLELIGSAELKFSSGSFVTIATGAILTLVGPDAVVAVKGGGYYGNTALSGLAANKGVLTLDGGSTVKIARAMTNSGVLNLEYGHKDDWTRLSIGGGLINQSGGSVVLGPGGAGYDSLEIAGALDNIGDLTLDSGSHEGAVKATAASLVNTGEIVLKTASRTSSTATLDISGVAGFDALGTLTGYVSLSGNSRLEFTSGQITTIATDATLDLSGHSAFVSDAAKLGSNSALKGLSELNGELELEDGASVTTIGPLTVAVAGELNLDSSVGFGDSVLTIDSAAGFGAAGVVTGSIDLSGASRIVFTSGSLTTIATGATLSLAGNANFVSDAGGAADSALQGLTTIEGTLSLSRGASLSLTGSLTNSGDMEFDPSGAGGSELAVAGTLTNEAGSQIFMAGNTLDDTLATDSVVNDGEIDIGGGAKSAQIITGTFTNDNIVNCFHDGVGGDLKVTGAVVGAGGVFNVGAYMEGASDLEFDGSVSAGQSVDFGSMGELTLGDAAQFSARLSGFGISIGLLPVTDEIDVKGFGTGTTAAMADDILTLTNGSHSASLKFTDFTYTLSDFAITTSATDTIVEATRL